MSCGYVLYNEKAGESNSLQSVKVLENIIDKKLDYIEVSEIKNYRSFFSKLKDDDIIILAGGDGTLNHFVNDVKGIDFTNEILYYPNGTGNDFAHDMGHAKGCEPFPITNCIKNLPSVTVNGKSHLFVNGVGYGIDGYCCEVGDKLKKIPGKKVNYTAIAVKGLLFHYKPTNAYITADGKRISYKRVWLAPTMNGRFYGGGMMPTPAQKRNSGKLSTMVFHSSGKLKTLTIFPSIFKGEHIKHRKEVEVLSSNEVTVEFDRPVALQIDGETILGVSSYTAKASSNQLKSDKTPATLSV